MKSSFLFIFCIVSIYGTLCCSASEVSPSAEDIDSVSNVCASALKYFKGKRMLDVDFSISVDSPKCQSSETLPEIFIHMREDLKEVLERRIPNEANCATIEFTERQRTLDLILAIRTIQLIGSLTEEEKMTRRTSLQNELEMDMKEIAAKCRVAEAKFL